jgi:GcrA cell cycle regulator
MAWTEDRVETLKKLWAEGLSASQIATRLGGVTRNAVIGKVHRLGLSGRVTPSRASRPRTSKPRQPSHPGRINTYRNAGATALKAEMIAEKSPIPDPVPAPIREVEIPPGERATILTLSEKTCRWPIGDPSADEFHFCGRMPSVNMPYCQHHCQIAYQPIQDRRRQKRAARRTGSKFATG